jgi:hypothetical protein
METNPKASLVPKIEEHLALVYKIANKEVMNLLSDADLSWPISTRGHFCGFISRADKTSYLEDHCALSKKRYQSTSELFTLFGTTMSEEYFKLGSALSMTVILTWT